jgi:signal transduction histidine kinase
MPVAVLGADRFLYWIALAPVWRHATWIGAAGVAMPLGPGLARTLAELTRSDVLILDGRGRVAAATDSVLGERIARAVAGRPVDGRVLDLWVEGRRYLVARGTLGEAATVAFTRDLQREVALLPKLRRVIVLSGVGALGLGLVLGLLFSIALARPVRSLATAADRLAGGDFEAPLSRSSIRELNRVAQAFDGMRRALSARVHELEAANRELADRQARLSALKSELLQRERLAASARLVTELAHEIRNPIANLRNCLELVRRRMNDDGEGREFANLAVDELQRLHKLAEQMLHLNRPRDPRVSTCEVASVALEVARLARVGIAPEELEVTVEGKAQAAITPDALKQVLLNLVENAREARPYGLRIAITVRRETSRISIDVADNGPGIAQEVLPRIFDPFFTTKESVAGTGLGLFIAEGLVRSSGGRITVLNDEGRAGARFRIELVAAESGEGEAGPSSVVGRRADRPAPSKEHVEAAP